jgi:hypothetical protein
MRAIVLSAAITALCLPLCPAQSRGNINPQEIIRKFAAKEAEFREALNNYVYRQSVSLEEVGADERRTGGKWGEIDDFIFGPGGKRTEKVLSDPNTSLKHLQLTPQDVQDLRDVQPFVLTTQDIGDYSVNYLGRGEYGVTYLPSSFTSAPPPPIDISCNMFSVKPKKMVRDKRYFEGQIWVDDRDPQVVKTYGRGVGIVSRPYQSIQFETYRQQIDGKHWFPNRAFAIDTLHFPDGQAQRIYITVEYSDYKRYQGETYGGVTDDTKNGTAAPPPKKQ